MKKGINIRKTIVLLITILIPLLVATFIGIYSYNRYSPYYFDAYMENIEESTSAKAHAFLKYTTVAYDKEPYYEKDVQKDGERALTIQVFRSIEEVTETVDGKDVIVNKVYYHIAIYNINYNKLIKIKDPTGEDKLIYNSLPSIHVRIKDKNDDEKVSTYTLSVPKDSLFIEDYNSSPSKDYNGIELTSKYLKWLTVTNASDFSQNVSFEIYMSDNVKKPEEGDYFSMIDSFEKTDFISKLDEFEKFEVGYQDNYKKAGYFAYILKTRLWWHVLLAIGLTGFISVMFFIIWNYEEQHLSQETVKKKKK